MKRQAFTLIELLIVVAIIAILAAIAVPNFLEAQVRAKTSRVQADLRSMATALEAYAVDHNRYPPYGRIDAAGTTNQYPATVNAIDDSMSYISPAITTPVAYITSIVEDPFYSAQTDPLLRQYEYLNLRQHVGNFPQPFPAPWMAELLPAWGGWRMVGAGPDLDRGLDIKMNTVYDPTNGTISDGDVMRCQRLSESRINTKAP